MQSVCLGEVFDDNYIIKVFFFLHTNNGYEVNSYLSQFALILVHSGPFLANPYSFGQLVHLVNLSSFWSIGSDAKFD